MPDTNSTNGVWSNRFLKAHTFLARHYLPCVVFVCMGGICLADGKLGWALLFSIVGILSSLWIGKKVFLLALSVGILGGLHHFSVVKKQRLAMAACAAESIIKMKAVVQNTAKPSGKGWSTEVSITECGIPALTNSHLLWSGSGMPPHVGDTLQAEGRLAPLPTVRNEGEFDHGDVLYRKNICGYFQSQNTDITASKHFLTKWRMENLRERFENYLTLGIENDERACGVIKAMVLGQYPRNQDATLRAFRESGTLHVFSVSGQHVAFMAVIVWFVLKWLRVPRKIALWFMIPFIFSYAWITGASAPAMRAAMMVSLVMLAFFYQRKVSYFHLLTLLFLVTILWNGHLLFHPGVQLSYAIVAALIVGANYFHEKIMKMNVHDSYLPKDLYSKSQKLSDISTKNVMGHIATSCVATLGSLPLCIAHFGMIAPISVITNVVLFYPVAACLSLGLLSAALAPLSPAAATFVNHGNAYVATTCINVCGFFAKIPGGHFAASLHVPSEDNIRIYDVPRGGAAVAVQASHHENLLDCGSASAFKNIVLPAARYFGDSPDTLILSHGDVAHIGGAEFAAEQLDLQHFVLPAAKAKLGSLKNFIRYLSNKNLNPLVAEKNATWQVSDDVHWQVLYAGDPWDIHSTADDRVCVMMLYFHQWKILFLNDAGTSIQEKLLSQNDIHADVLVAGHNDTTSYFSQEFINRVSPQVAIITHANFPEDERISPFTEKFLSGNGITLFHQGKCGMVKISLANKNELIISSYLSDKKLTLKK